MGEGRTHLIENHHRKLQRCNKRIDISTVGWDKKIEHAWSYRMSGILKERLNPSPMCKRDTVPTYPLFSLLNQHAAQ